MIYADVKGKTGVPEDVFTSNCIELLTLLPHKILIEFIALSINLKGESIDLSGIEKIDRIEFWPWINSTSEPDILCVLKNETGSKLITLVIEVKHGGGKSGFAQNDQLAKYWKSTSIIYKNVVILYLTHHRDFPKQDIKDSLKETGNKALIYWINWHYLYQYIVTLIENRVYQSTELRILEKLKLYLEEKGYKRFQDFNIPTTCTNYTPYWRNYSAPMSIAYNRDIYNRLFVGLTQLKGTT
jgi:hypothetical protein